MKRSLLPPGLALALAALLAGCGAGGGVREIRIVATENRYAPAVVQARAGEKIKLVIENLGREEHEFESEQIKFDELKIPPGKTRTVVVTMPARSGEYEFFCDAPGHRADGMTGKIVVTAP